MLAQVDMSLLSQLKKPEYIFAVVVVYGVVKIVSGMMIEVIKTTRPMAKLQQKSASPEYQVACRMTEGVAAKVHEMHATMKMVDQNGRPLMFYPAERVEQQHTEQMAQATEQLRIMEKINESLAEQKTVLKSRPCIIDDDGVHRHTG